MGAMHPVVPRQVGGELFLGGPAEEFTEQWLANRRLSEHTRAAYRRDVHGWLGWCEERGLEPLRATFLQVNTYARELEAQNLAPSTVARKLSGLSSWYDFLLKLQAVTLNPVAGADRPYVNRDYSATVGLSPDEVGLLLKKGDKSDRNGERDRAVITLLADLGLRVGEVVGLDLADLGRERGHRTIRFVGKGNKQRRRALTPTASEALDGYLGVRGTADGPLFLTSRGNRLDRHAVFRLVRRLALQAGLSEADRLSPHSLRHAFATTARSEGVPLEDVQDAMGHADPRTTRRYDRDRHNLDRDPAYTVAAARVRRSGA
jgi:site-specific recombinase XerD